MEPHPKISVIVPVYNVESYLHRCVDSLLAQDYQNLEIILVDDGSPDGCPQICDAYAKKDHRIRVIHKENGGVSSARNAGLDVMTGKYVTFVDSDDFVHPEYISYMHNLSQEFDCDIVQSDFLLGNENVFPKMTDDYQEKICDKYEVLGDFKYKVLAWGKLYTTAVIGDIRFPVGLINEDDATYYRFADQSNRICISDRKLYYYYMSPNSVFRNNDIHMDFLDIYEERLAYFREKNDAVLIKGSYERFALVLILKYCSFIKKKANGQQLGTLREEYHKIFVQSLLSAKWKYKPLLVLFRMFPKMTAKLIRMVKEHEDFTYC